jgi:hypothetical protein
MLHNYDGNLNVIAEMTTLMAKYTKTNPSVIILMIYGKEMNIRKKLTNFL